MKTVYIVYGQDWVYGRDTYVLGVFEMLADANKFIDLLEKQGHPCGYKYVWEKWEVT